MKFLNKYILILTVLPLALSEVSCKKEFLEIQPKGYAIAKNTSDYEQLMNATYLATTFTAAGYLGDDMAAQQQYYDAALLRMQRLFQFADTVYQPDELPLEITDALSY